MKPAPTMFSYFGLSSEPTPLPSASLIPPSPVPFSSCSAVFLVKSQLATVSRSLAALTMASGIMLNAAPRLLSPSTGVNAALLERTGRRWRTLNEDVTAITQARFMDTLCVCATVSHKPLIPLFSTLLKSSLIS